MEKTETGLTCTDEASHVFYKMCVEKNGNMVALIAWNGSDRDSLCHFWYSLVPSMHAADICLSLRSLKPHWLAVAGEGPERRPMIWRCELWLVKRGVQMTDESIQPWCNGGQRRNRLMQAVDKALPWSELPTGSLPCFEYLKLSVIRPFDVAEINRWVWSDMNKQTTIARPTN